MKKYLLYPITILCMVTALVLPSCNPKTTTVTAEQTDECALMEEICAEALDFQKEYERLPDEEKKDMASVMETYRKHCEEATKNCEKSKK